MSNIKVLDCTLRDGGYVNDWNFGKKNIQKIITGLFEANIDIMECGYLSDKAENSKLDLSMFMQEKEINEIIGSLPHKSIVAMIDYGDYDVEQLPDANDSVLTGIRLAFHKKDLHNVETACDIIKRKGYDLYLQPMVSLSYSDMEFLQLIHITNRIVPYAFYIVDSFGTLKQKDLKRMLYMSDKNMNSNICLGFHSHNNLQLAYSNAQLVVMLQTNRTKIIDSSIFGMGRGAGNLNTELFLDFINDNYEGKYNIKPLLKIIDSIINPIYQEKYWGYSLAHYISAIHACHPNYATHLINKNSLLLEDIEQIIASIEGTKKYSYDIQYLEELYHSYMAKRDVGINNHILLENEFAGKKVLVIAPGKSSLIEQEKILEAVNNEKLITVSVNHEYSFIDNLDYIFVSNIRRFQMLDKNVYNKTIITSNINSNEKVFAQVSYQALLNDKEDITDNAGMMLIRLLINLGVKEIQLAGIDGYMADYEDNYSDKSLKLIMPKHITEKMNAGITELLQEYSKEANIYFVTTPRHLKAIWSCNDKGE